MSENFDELAAKLNAHPDFQVLRKLQPVKTYNTSSATTVKRALLVDVETTGLSHANDVIIELGVILFTYEYPSGCILEVLESKSWFDDPGRAIPEAVVKLTGITDADVKGQRIDEVKLREMAADARFIVAHNAGFDRPFIDRKFPFLADRHWGCSLNDVPWNAMSIGSHKLDYLLYAHAKSFLDTHHRALDDCRATLHVLATPFAEGHTPMELLLVNCRATRVKVAAVRAAFEMKDVLKQRGYSWSGDGGTPAKAWCKEILKMDLDAELAWLREHVYANAAIAPQVDAVDLQKRYQG